MADHILNRTYNENLRKLTTTDAVHADVVNALLEQLINNDASIKDLVGATKNKSWVSTAGQLTYTFTEDSYTLGQLSIIVGGVPQVSGVNFTEDSTTSFTFLCDPSEIPDGLTICAVYR